ncbi:hypothetical protein [Candidatus Palauibacter sp.]|uniref:hypothetical protein n=1 Tax=Candidatus Palauibacter sp. TaxID=3101350 RepID=UPI003B5C70EC
MKTQAVLASVLAFSSPIAARTVIDLPGEDRPLSGEAEFVYRIGSAVAAEAWEEFSSIRDVGFDRVGNLYVLDASRGGAQRVIVVDATGEFIVEFDRPGDGPGKLRMALRVT